MDEPFAVDATRSGILTAAKTLREIPTEAPSRPIYDGIKCAQKIAKISVITLLSIGIVEVLIGQISGSVVATADGTDSLSDAMISFIVFMGLVIAGRPADKKFHFGYYKVESFAALIAAIGMIVVGSIILYQSSASLLLQHKHEIHQPILTMVVLAAASVISLYRAIQMRNIANRHNLLSLRTDAKNSIKDGSASVVGFLSVLIATQFGFSQMDAIGGIIIAGYIFSVAYVSLKQSSLILVDSWQNPKVTDLIRQTVEDKFKKKDQFKVSSILLRPAGMRVVFAAVHIEVEGSKTLADVELLTREVETVIRSKIPYIKKISVIPHSLTPLSILSESTSI
ncbi:MAG TPA: cation diffusion facilitator family transporter [Candidatus Nitrosopolaris sp.]|nr:cation diffusion facilitator family transporter [Candidatus Nitrosopolaris sp.]